MDIINKIKDIFKKIGVSIPAAVPWVGPAYAQFFSQLSSEKQQEFLTELLTALRELKEGFEGQLEANWKQLQSIGVTTKERIDQEIKLLEAIKRLSLVFSAPQDEFQFLIERNFLYKFDGSDNSDYLRLLSSDFNDLFFSFFNSNNCICIVGRRGIGKTFNCLLISKKLEQERYKVHYSSVRKAQLSEETFSELTGLVNKDFVFIIDDCQANTEKANAILKRVISLKKDTERPKLILLIRNDDLSEEDIKDILGEKVPILEFKERFTDLKFLAELFLRKINLTEKLNDFLLLLEKGDLSKALFKYKNMGFWNRFFKQVEHSREIKIREEEFYKSAYKYFSDKEPHLIQCKDILGKFLPFFKNELPILRKHIENTIGAYPEQYQTLTDHKVVALEPQDWGHSSDIFIVPNLHSTEAEILQLVFQKYEGLVVDEKAVLTDYIKNYPSNLYELITPFYFYGTETLEELCEDELFISEVRAYLKKKKLGKRVDRVIKTFSKLEPRLKDQLIDEEVIDSLAEKLNRRGPYIVNKLNLFGAMYKVSPVKAYQLYQEFNSEILIDDFNNDPRGLFSFIKFMEVFKNIYYYADENGKANIINTLKRILEGCFEQFIEKFEKHDFFTQFHWFLKRLDGMKLANYFLEKIPSAKIVEWIRTKNMRINELRFLFKNARFVTLVGTDGTKEKLYSYFRNSLNYEDVRRTFANKRSKLYDIAITSKFSHEILANYLYQYSYEDNFAEKISIESNLYRINESIELLEANPGLSNEQKGFINHRIVENVNFGERLLKETIKTARKIGKEINIDSEKERFLNYKGKYGGNFG